MPSSPTDADAPATYRDSHRLASSSLVIVGRLLAYARTNSPRAHATRTNATAHHNIELSPVFQYVTNIEPVTTMVPTSVALELYLVGKLNADFLRGYIKDFSPARSTQVGLSPGSIIETVPDNCRGAPTAKGERESRRVRRSRDERVGGHAS